MFLQLVGDAVETLGVAGASPLIVMFGQTEAYSAFSFEPAFQDPAGYQARWLRAGPFRLANTPQIDALIGMNDEACLFRPRRSSRTGKLSTQSIYLHLCKFSVTNEGSCVTTPVATGGPVDNKHASSDLSAMRAALARKFLVTPKSKIHRRSFNLKSASQRSNKCGWDTGMTRCLTTGIALVNVRW